MQVLPAKRREENITGKYSREIIWGSKWGISCKYM